MLRYGIFYLLICNTIKSYEDAKTRLPYSGVVSNFGFIIQTRFSEIKTSIVNLWHKDYISIVLVLISLCIVSQINFSFEKSNLYNDNKKIKRGLMQSMLLFSSLTTTKYITSTIQVEVLQNIKLYDIIPLFGSFLIILLNQKYINHVNYKYYNLFGIVTNTCFLSIKYIYTLPDYLNKLCIVLCWGFHFLINNPSRYILYITHSVDVIHHFIAFDLFIIILSNIVTIFMNNIYSMIFIIVLWMYAIIYSLKYYKKDIYCEECVNILQV